MQRSSRCGLGKRRPWAWRGTRPPFRWHTPTPGPRPCSLRSHGLTPGYGRSPAPRAALGRSPVAPANLCSTTRRLPMCRGDLLKHRQVTAAAGPHHPYNRPHTRPGTESGRPCYRRLIAPRDVMLPFAAGRRQLRHYATRRTSNRPRYLHSTRRPFRRACCGSPRPSQERFAPRQHARILAVGDFADLSLRSTERRLVPSQVSPARGGAVLASPIRVIRPALPDQESLAGKRCDREDPYAISVGICGMRPDSPGVRQRIQFSFRKTVVRGAPD